MPTLGETSPELIKILQLLFDEYGPAGVAQTVEQMRDLLADDASTFPDGHPCRDCGRLYKDHPTDFCEGWR